MSAANAIAGPASALRNITPFDEIVIEIDDLYAEAGNWADGTDIENDEQDQALDALDKKLLKAGQRAAELREAEKKPHDDQVKAIQAKYHRLIGDTKAGKGLVPLARGALSPIRSRYKAKRAAEKEAAAAKAREEEQRLRREAEDAIRASAGNLAEREVAEEKLGLANEAAAFAKRQEKRATTGLGLRTSYKVEVNDLNAAVRHFWKLNAKAFEALVTDLAKTAVTAGAREIPGFIITEIKKAI